MSSACPRLRADVLVVERRHGDESSYIVKDPSTQKYFRMRATEVHVLRCLDGVRTAADVVRTLAAEGATVSIRAVEQFAATCARLGLLERSLAERSTLELERLRAERHRRRSLFRGELLRMRWSFGDCDALLTRLLRAARWCFTPAFAMASAALLSCYFIFLATHWRSIASAVGQLTVLQSETVGRIALLWVVVLAVSAVHEVAHGITCKYYGGRVHEIGFMLVLFQPAFYCNVSDAWSFPERRARLVVTAAGVWAELLIAALATVAWWVVRPGTTLSELALMVMLVSGAVTLVENGNPLLPLDGYFALSDWLEIPNLRQRALAHAGWWVRARVLRVDAPEPAATERDRRVFVVFGLLAALYSTFLVAFTAWFVVRIGWRAWGLTGALLAVLAVTLLVRRTLAAWWRAVRSAIATHGRALAHSLRRSRGARQWGIGALVLLVMAALLPWSIGVSAPFRVMSARGMVVIAPGTGVVTEVAVREGDEVAVGATLLRMSDPGQLHAAERQGRDVDSLAGNAAGALAVGDANEAARLDAERSAADERVTAMRRRLASLTVRAPATGEVITPRPELLLGRRLTAGQSVLTLGDRDSVEVRVLLTGPGAAEVRPGQSVHLISFADVSQPIERQVLSVSAAGKGREQAGEVEARVHLPRSPAWRPGVSGEARVVLARTTLLEGVIWWVRGYLRADFLL